MKKPAPKIVPREDTILDAARDMVYSARNAVYGHPSRNFQDIADYWNVHLADKLTSPITALDVAAMNTLQKMSRLRATPTHMDTIADIAGYAATMERVITGK